MAKKKTHGGKRSRSGRKPIDPAAKKVQITLYIEQRKIDAVGGLESAKEKASSVFNQLIL